jgi:hypothetical protein
MTRGTAAPARSCWTDAYAWAHCEGYRVDSEAGEHLGSVDRVVWPEDGREADAVLVQSVCGDREIVVPLGSVVEIRPWEERIIVPRPVAELLRRAPRRVPARAL